MMMSPAIYGVAMGCVVVTTAVAGVAGAMTMTSLQAELQYRHPDVWTKLGRPSLGTQSPFDTRWEKRRLMFRFVYWRGFRALNDPRVTQLCNRMHFCAATMFAALLAGDSIYR
jgi:hypothetical protein